MDNNDEKVLKVMTVKQVAEALQCSKTHVYTLINTGHLPAVDVSRPGSLRSDARVLVNDFNTFVSRPIGYYVNNPRTPC